MLKNIVSIRVFPTDENQAELKSLYFPLKIGRKPKNSGGSSSVASVESDGLVKSKLIIKMMRAVFINCTNVNF